MSDKKQLAAMGAQYRLTEEQAKGLAERMPQTGALQVIDDEPLCTEIRINGVEACGADIGGLLDRCLPHTTEQKPLCMAKRIEELEAQLEKLTNRLAWRNTGSPNGLRRFMTQKKHKAQAPGIQKWYEPTRHEVPEGWQLVPVEPTDDMFVVGGERLFDCVGPWEGDDDTTVKEQDFAATIYRAMLAAAPSLDSAK